MACSTRTRPMERPRIATSTTTSSTHILRPVGARYSPRVSIPATSPLHSAKKEMRRRRCNNAGKRFHCKMYRRRGQLHQQTVYSIDITFLSLYNLKNSNILIHSHKLALHLTPFDSFCKRSRTVTTNLYLPFSSCGILIYCLSVIAIIFAGLSISTFSPAPKQYTTNL